jgi:hypothetical protein
LRRSIVNFGVMTEAPVAGETILLVEDYPAVRAAIAKSLAER